MRQAGRSLPEYRKLREKYSFKELITQPDLATQATLQPVTRFGFDAAILFSDILVIPEALGQKFRFTEAGGLQMEYTIRCPQDLQRLNLDGFTERTSFVPAAIKLVKKELKERAALLGFAGSPWTLANFMMGDGASSKRRKAWNLYRADPASYQALAAKLTVAVSKLLAMQIDAGADAVQIFDSVGGFLPEPDFENASGQWIRRIVESINRKVPVIVYSKGTRVWRSLIGTGAHCISIDHGVSLTAVSRIVGPEVALQGNLNPALLAHASISEIAVATQRLLCVMGHRPGYIFNLGHGVPPDARLANLHMTAETVQTFA
jgi:uroporphyrinogen decarboxylase